MTREALCCHCLGVRDHNLIGTSLVCSMCGSGFLAPMWMVEKRDAEASKGKK
jgi:hypothetical protein